MISEVKNNSCDKYCALEDAANEGEVSLRVKKNYDSQIEFEIEKLLEKTKELPEDIKVILDFYKNSKCTRSLFSLVKNAIAEKTRDYNNVNMMGNSSSGYTNDSSSGKNIKKTNTVSDQVKNNNTSLLIFINLLILTHIFQ